MSKFICPDKHDIVIGIKRVSNGYVVQETNDMEEERNITETVFQEHENSHGSGLDDLMSMVDLLLHVKQSLGVFYSKHNKMNIQITIVNEEENGVS